MSHHFQHMA